jgi:hypothetical protein
MATPKLALSSRTALQLWPEQVDLLLQTITTSIAMATDADVRSQQEDLLEYIRGRAWVAAAVKSALEAKPDDAQVEAVWGDVWVNRVFEGREPNLDQIKREMCEYWQLLQLIGMGAV